MNKIRNNVKGAFWTISAFYAIIAFEFFYMATPFAVYFYSVYEPGLNFLNRYKSLSWLTGFFLPHIINETTSAFLNMHNVFGVSIAIMGFAGFLAGAVQIYYNKLRKQGAVTGGIYNRIRHPQYLSFAVCSFGLLLLWPRFIVLVMFVTMLFAYYVLAKAEEKECGEKYGQSYTDYKNKTNMFFPFSLPTFIKAPALPESMPLKVFALLLIFALTQALSIFTAKEIQKFSLSKLYAVYTDKSAFISVTKIEDNEFKKIVETVMNDNEVKNCLSGIKDNENAMFLNYILPSEWYISEIPMNPVNNAFRDHFFASGYKKDTFKLIITKALIDNPEKVKNGRDIIINLTGRIPVAEVWFSSSQMKIIDIKSPPSEVNYEKIPVAVY